MAKQVQTLAKKTTAKRSTKKSASKSAVKEDVIPVNSSSINTDDAEERIKEMAKDILQHVGVVATENGGMSYTPSSDLFLHLTALAVSVEYYVGMANRVFHSEVRDCLEKFFLYRLVAMGGTKGSHTHFSDYLDLTIEG